MADQTSWERLYRADTLVSLGVAAMTGASGFAEGIPYTYLIPAVLLASCAALFLWRQLSVRRLFLPTKVESFYENELLRVQEVFQGRSILRNVTFKNVEFAGPSCVYIDETCQLSREVTFNPDLKDLMLTPTGRVHLAPHYRFSHCSFEGVIFTNVAILISPHNHQLFGLTPTLGQQEEVANQQEESSRTP